MRLILILCLLPATAVAECPVPGDLAKGIIATSTNGGMELFEAARPGVVTSTYMENGEPLSQSLLGQGVYLLQSINLEDGRPTLGNKLSYAYPMAPKDMPLPTAGGKWDVSTLMDDYGDFKKSVVNYKFSKEREITIGDCSYSGFEVSVQYSEGIDYQETLDYLPDLGISLITAYIESDGTVDRYTTTKLETRQ